MRKGGSERMCLNVILHRSQHNARAVNTVSTLHKLETREVERG